VGAALAHRWEPLFRGGAPPQRLTMGAVQESQTTSNPPSSAPRLMLLQDLYGLHMVRYSSDSGLA